MNKITEKAAIVCQRVWRSRVITTPCFCEEEYRPNTLRYGDRCFTCGDMECYDGSKENSVHYVLQKHIKYGSLYVWKWSCRPLTLQDFYDKKVAGGL